MTSKIIIAVILGILAIAGAYTLRSRRTKIKRIGRFPETDCDGNRIVKKCTVPRLVPPASLIDITLLKDHMKKISSSIGMLWQISRYGDDNNLGSILFDNLNRAVAASDSPELKKQWEAFAGNRSQWSAALYKDKSSELLDMLKQAGVAIGDISDLIWEARIAGDYRKFGAIQDGDRCKVLVPCIIYEDVVIEQGLVQKIN